MRKLLVLAAAIAAASCGGNSSNLSQAEAQSVASEISAALQSAEASGQNQFSLGGTLQPVTKQCDGGGSLTVSGSLSVNCPWGLRSCTTAGSLTVTADQCTTDTGVIISGSVTATVAGTGFLFTKTVTGSLTITRGEESKTCDVNLMLMLGHLGGTVCGIDVSK